MSPTYGYMTRPFLELEFQHKGNKEMKKTRILSKILRFSWQEQIQKIKIFNYYTELDKKIFGQNCHHWDRNLPLMKWLVYDLLSRTVLTKSTVAVFFDEK